MEVRAASVTLTTSRLPEVRSFYEHHFGAEAVFDCGWYVVLRLGSVDGAPELCLMEPQSGAGEFAGGITINLRVADADTVHTRLTEHGVELLIPLEDHPWGDRGFGVCDPCGATVYCYHPIEPAPEFKQYFRAR